MSSGGAKTHRHYASRSIPLSSVPNREQVAACLQNQRQTLTVQLLHHHRLSITTPASQPAHPAVHSRPAAPPTPIAASTKKQSIILASSLESPNLQPLSRRSNKFFALTWLAPSPNILCSRSCASISCSCATASENGMASRITLVETTHNAFPPKPSVAAVYEVIVSVVEEMRARVEGGMISMRAERRVEKDSELAGAPEEETEEISESDRRGG